MILNKKAIFPELVATGVKKWYLLAYDEFIHLGALSDFCKWGEDKVEQKIDIDIFEYFDKEDFKEFSKGSISFGEKPILDFLSENVIEGNPRELFLQAAFISDYENIVVYLNKGFEIVLIGIIEEKIIKDFEYEFVSKLTANLSKRLRYVLNVNVYSVSDSELFMKNFVKNYFPNFLYEFKHIDAT